MKAPFSWRGRRVFLTGHTGFWGSWTTLALSLLGARVRGFALPPEHERSLFQSANLRERCEHRIGDIRDRERLRRETAEFEPEIVLHLAAQPLVFEAYATPLETFETNVQGTVNVVDAVRGLPSTKTVVVVTTDKVYDTSAGPGPYGEESPLGGNDPYSASKSAAEMAVRGFAAVTHHARATDGPSFATVRAGNIIGGGDWAANRLVPDAVRAFERSSPLILRRPDAVRPWQFVLDAVRGLLAVAEHQWIHGRPELRSWNIGPSPAEKYDVGQVAEKISRAWGDGAVVRHDASTAGAPETKTLLLDPTRANRELGWHTRLPFDEAIRLTVRWYRTVLREKSPTVILRESEAQLCATGIGAPR